ncbi:methyltransferase, FkbM family [Bacteroidales bacterium Barb6XT]|nr:methyltransferase, FkbM family [Bacteroidales bacterium Barb6XT]
MEISINENNSGANSIISKGADCKSEKIAITTLDKFVKENNIEKVDFIKADIEGAERDMLRGATNVLKTFAPKLAICTYHLLDDPEVLEKIILEANPDYKVVHLRHKLFAAVVKQ